MSKNSGFYSRGFTLVELLVTISIIGLLSSIVLASVVGVRDQASVGAGETFSANVHTSLFSNAVVYFDFDGANGSNLDTIYNSGYGSGGSCTGSKPICLGSSASFPTDTSLYKRGNNLEVTPSGATNPFRWFDGASADIANAIRGLSFTYSTWYKPVNCSDAATRSCLLIANTSNGLIGDNGAVLRAIFDAGNNIVGVDTQIDGVSTITNVNVKNGQWAHFAFSVKKNTNSNVAIALYINGTMVMNNPSLAIGTNTAGGGRFVIGGDAGSVYAGGFFDDSALFSQTLLTSDVQKLYLAGLPEHPLALADADQKR